METQAGPKEISPIIKIWDVPPTMDARAPDPCLLRSDADLWLGYRIARDPDHFAVLRFEGMQHYALAEPDEGHLYEHAFFPYGLESFRFHEVLPPLLLADQSEAGLQRWIVSFREETLDVVARGVKLSARAIAAQDSASALASIRA
ncbi:MAG: hypothetical protein ABJD11_10835 [Gemmatimonadota bacterium]